ncbi:acyl-homoserine-lactone synthase [Asticcacaulis sp.]|uniref:acyl-homoserine-lactone synthase n=1 Tax=Asticcacaulis sp. TaxID=1872648 RepID=UPI002B710133|nr:acyl-homoserine-lactone synthase [Asticcacaulis sp.]HTM81554.1 acyl-homoserine-lactone synthase [Asticcacaulis sp.]
MLILISFKTIRKHADLYSSMLRLRNREFMVRQHYEVKTFDGMEFDSYDNLTSNYIVFSEGGKRVLGASRLTPISYGCMLADHFPDLVDDHKVFADDRVWESTRFVVDSSLSSADRVNISRHMVCGNIEFGLANGVTQIIGVMPTLILRSVFERAGVHLDRLGVIRQIGEHSKVQAASIRINRGQLDRVRDQTGLHDVLGLETEATADHG